MSNLEPAPFKTLKKYFELFKFILLPALKILLSYLFKISGGLWNVIEFVK